ncbi:hypothetical protein [Photobacterium rosenbergii]|uniref:Uncharacterized protein n=1 Tax=Photobacterium rosenbergii TaxID=294936 RepID=A0A2T3NK98_9GAMM|nr:hypothetical protein [Photobacterium rosenbergii]MBY5946450.1 hypothetical protein [Photobacterium rosenbergii]PSW15900.1 hypothetical protein C9J01_02495 [Photobacterium rosenbergii]
MSEVYQQKYIVEDIQDMRHGAVAELIEVPNDITDQMGLGESNKLFVDLTEVGAVELGNKHFLE